MSKKIVLIIVFTIGLIIPFIPTLTIIQMFFLLIPFSIIFIVTLINLLFSLFGKKTNSRNAIFIFSILPIFILSQFIAGVIVDNVQRLRSKIIISEIQNIKNKTGSYPELYDTTLGIEYRKLKNKNIFEITYSRGFMVTEKYNSEENKWNSFGWND